MRVAEGKRYRLPNGKVVTAQRDAQRKVWVLAPDRGKAVWIVSPGGKLLQLTGGVATINPNQIRIPGWTRDDLKAVEEKATSAGPLEWLKRLLGLAPQQPEESRAPRHLPRPRRPYTGPDVLDRVMLIVDEEDDEDDMADRLKWMEE